MRTDENGVTWVGLAGAGVLRVAGRDRVDLLQRLSTNDVTRLGRPGAVFSTLFTNEKGRVVDWVVVLAREDHLLLRTSAGRAASVAAWIDRFTILEDVRVTDVTGEHRLLVAQGPDAEAVAEAAPTAGRWVAARGGLATRGDAAYGTRVELLVAAGDAPDLLEVARQRGGCLADVRELERLRLLAGVPSPEHEFKEEVIPLELRLGRVAVAFNKGCYLGQEVIARLDSYDKVARLLMGFEVDDEIASGEATLQRDGRPIGRVTSTLPVAGGTLGLAVVRREAATPGPMELVIAGSARPGRLVDRPFWSGPA